MRTKYIFVFAIFGNFFTQYVYEQTLANQFMSPIEGFKLGHWLGTDYAGRTYLQECAS